MKFRMTIAAFLAGLTLAAHAQTASAASEVRIARQYGIAYLPMTIMERDKLVEKYARAAGLKDVTVKWSTFAGANVMNDALLSNSLDLAAVGTTVLPLMWSKTKGTPQEIKGVCAIASAPHLLNTRNPNVKSIRDFSSSDRIALPAAKVSIQAVELQMAASQAFGMKNYGKLDAITVSRSHPDAMAALLSGTSEIDAHFTWAPYSFRELKDPRIHTVLNSFDVLGGPTTTILILGTKRFHDQNPKLYEAFLKAMHAAGETIKTNKPYAAKVYLEATKDTDSLADVEKMLNDPQIQYTIMPQRVEKFVTFMHEIGTLKTVPASWQEMFFPEVFTLGAP
ncbi:MAG: ABC transporter substrate-binding protein [Candidimonas sp.]|nr:MAG: ABC transporter substrate-binding protein [Candidimonas sp.]